MGKHKREGPDMNTAKSPDSASSAIESDAMSGGSDGKAMYAVRELVETERSYCGALKHMLATYHQPLRDAQDKLKPLLPEQDIDCIFGNAEDLLVINTQLLQELESRLADPVPPGEAAPRVGDIMKRAAPLLQLYDKYVRNYDRASLRLSECQHGRGPHHAEFMAFLERQQGGGASPLVGEGGTQALESYLIMPVQRILRYNLLLEEVLRHTPPTSRDRRDLEEALALVQERAVLCNEVARRQASPPPQASLDGAHAAAGAAAIAGGVAVPVAVVAGVQSLGFGSAGIVAGSTAASWMSASAIASGGGVPSMASYGMVATLQSIGATASLGVGTTMMAASAGALVMAGAGYGTYRGAQRLRRWYRGETALTTDAEKQTA